MNDILTFTLIRDNEGVEGSGVKLPSSPPPRTSLSGKLIEDVERAIHAVETKTAGLIADADVERTKLLKRKKEREADDGGAGPSGYGCGKSPRGDALSSPIEGERGDGRSRITTTDLRTSLERITTNSEDAALFCWNCGREVSGRYCWFIS